MDERGLILEREKSHGPFHLTAKVTQNLQDAVMSTGAFYERLSYIQRTAIMNFHQKEARIVVGDRNNRDHWLDIIGYAQLALREIDEADGYARLAGDSA